MPHRAGVGTLPFARAVVLPASTPSPAAVADLIATRRSPPRFDADAPVDPDLVRRALAAATTAPNHKRTEPWRFAVFGPDARTALIDLNAAIFTERQGEEAGASKRTAWAGIPAFVLVTQRLADDPVRRQEDYAAVACAIQNLALVLHAGGVGTKWTTGPVTRDPRLAALAGFDPDTEAVVGLLHIGVPAPDLPPRPPRKSVDDVTTWLP